MKIIAIDDHVLFRNGLRRFFSTMPDLDLVGEAGTARDAFRIIDAARPDVVLMDIGLPDMDGVAATREIMRMRPGTRVLIVSVHDQISDVLDALQAGAAGYALKNEAPERLAAAIRLVARGERYLAPAVAACISAHESRRQRRDHDVLALLSQREQTVFRLAAECVLAREIAEQLHISRKTVDTHLYRIHRKLGLRGAAELVRLAAGLRPQDRPQAQQPQEAPRAPAPSAPRRRVVERQPAAAGVLEPVTIAPGESL